jgi:hypothetical protein
LYVLNSRIAPSKNAQYQRKVFSAKVVVSIKIILTFIF